MAACTPFASFNCGTIQWISPKLSNGMYSKLYRVNVILLGIDLVPISHPSKFNKLPKKKPSKCLIKFKERF